MTLRRPPRRNVAAFVIPRNQLAVPTKDCVRRDDRADLAKKSPTEVLAFRDESPALIVCELDALPAELRSEHPVLLPQILVGVLQLFIEPARDEHRQHLVDRMHVATLPHSGTSLGLLHDP
ncbi:MAG: hypothetical protein IT432_12165 [Phycisphaerales bacterium]|nr:hypothetical protein [Phycisphaerales bacterium]